MTDTPCPRCLPLAFAGRIRHETVQRLPEGAWAPRARPIEARRCTEHEDCEAHPALGEACAHYQGPCCLDCASADTLLAMQQAPCFVSARIAVGNDRQEQYRLPGIPMGLVAAGLVRPSAKGDFETHLAWLDKHNWFGLRPEDDA